MNGEPVKDELRRFIVENYLAGDASDPVGDDDSFLQKGIIDSIGVIELTQFVQERYGIKIEVKEIVPENFDTLRNLEKYIASKRGANRADR
jgi:acyl carrier protein